MNFNEALYYICPVCGEKFSSEDDQPDCDFCKNHTLIIYSIETSNDIHSQVEKMSPLEFQENLKLGPWDKFYIELYAGDKEKIKKNSFIKSTSTTALSLTKPSLICVPSGNTKTP